MTQLIANLSTGKGTWEHVRGLMEKEDWDSIILVANDFAKCNFRCSKEAEIIVIDPDRYLSDLTKDIHDKISGKVRGLEVGLNCISGTGKEHMALMSALLKIGVGVRLVALTPKGVEEI